MEEINETVVGLPAEVPKEWLEQIKKEVSTDLLFKLAASSVIAAVVGWSAAYFTARMTIDANINLEQVKAQLQSAQQTNRDKTIAYSNIANSLNNLRNALTGYRTFLQAGAADGEMLTNQLHEIGKAQTSLSRALQDPHLDNDSLRGDIQDCLGDLAPALADAEKSPRSFLSRPNLDSRIGQLMTRAQQLANAQMISQ